MNEKQQRRADILSRASAGSLTRQQAAELVGVSDRQLRRLLAQYSAQGLASVVHGNSGRVPANKTPPDVREKLSALAGSDGTYHGFNACHLQELLAEREGITLGRSTLDRLLKEAGIRKRKRGRPRRLFRRRERRAQEGEMLLTDASPHDWLEGRGPRYGDGGKSKKLCLLGSVDDATSRITHLRFWPSECQAGYITMAREVTTSYGIPMSYYHDRHTILCSPKEQTIEDELAGREPMSQFQAVLAQLGVEAIRAMTPQAKGRIERMWRTLQDRLIKEMRLEGTGGISTLEAANAFLPDFIGRYNARFGVEASDPQPAWVTPEVELDIPFYFAAKEERVVRADHTLSWYGKTLLVKRSRGERSLAGSKVMVHVTPEGECFLYDKKEQLRFEELKGPLPKLPKTSAPRTERPERTPQQVHQQVQERQTARRRQMAHLHAISN